MTVGNEDYLKGMAIVGADMSTQGLPTALQNGTVSTLQYLYPDPDRTVADPGHMDEFSGLFARMAVRSAIYTYDWNSPFEQFVTTLNNGKGKLLTALETPKMDTFDAHKSDLLVRDYGDPHQKFVPLNFSPRKTISISATNLKTALLTDGEISTYQNAQTNTLTNADRIASYVMQKKVIADAIRSGKVPNVHVDIKDSEHPTSEELEQLSVLSRKYALQLGVVPSALYNMAHVTTISSPDAMRAFLVPNLNANMMVKVLANAFNMTQTGIQQRMLFLDDLGFPDLYMILADREWLVNARLIRTIQAMPFDPSTQSFNLSLVHRAAIGVNPFKNAITFSSNPTTLIEQINITPPTSVTARMESDDGAVVDSWDPTRKMPLHISVDPQGGTVTPDIAEYMVPSGHRTEVSSDNPTNLNASTYVDRFDVVHFQKRPKLKEGSKLTFHVISHANDNPSNTVKDEVGKAPLTAEAVLTIKYDRDGSEAAPIAQDETETKS